MKVSRRDRAARAKGSTPDAEATDADTTAGTDNADATSADSDARPSGKRSSTPRGKRGAATDVDGATTAGGVALKERSTRTDTSTATSRNPFVRLWTFLRQVVGELKKVIWPTRSEMVRYTIIVLIFVVVMTAFISGIDLGFAKAVLWLFG
jgi:preprotein translocase subunit SecE